MRTTAQATIGVAMATLLGVGAAFWAASQPLRPLVVPAGSRASGVVHQNKILADSGEPIRVAIRLTSGPLAGCGLRALATRAGDTVTLEPELVACRAGKRIRTGVPLGGRLAGNDELIVAAVTETLPPVPRVKDPQLQALLNQVFAARTAPPAGLGLAGGTPVELEVPLGFRLSEVRARK